MRDLSRRLITWEECMIILGKSWAFKNKIISNLINQGKLLIWSAWSKAQGPRIRRRGEELSINKDSGLRQMLGNRE